MKTVGPAFGLRLGTYRHYRPRQARLPSDLEPRERAGGGPLVSIVTPSYNQGRYLGATLESVLGQRYPRIEYVVQDGGSTDESVEVIRRHADRLASWESGPDGGHGDGLNRGFARASGEIMGWLNSDDLLLPGAVEAAVRAFEDDASLDVVYGHRLFVDEAGSEVGRWILPRHSDDALVWRDYIPQETMFWRRSIWERAGGRIDETLDFAVDWDLVLRFWRAGARFQRLDRLMGGFRTHSSQKSLAQVETVGLGEFDLLRRRYIRGRLDRARAQLGSAKYLLASVPAAWRGVGQGGANG